MNTWSENDENCKFGTIALHAERQLRRLDAKDYKQLKMLTLRELRRSKDYPNVTKA
ncbi:hypothetical protein [Acidaminobacter hydrogenoformans]|uniref:Uncharacterized protein n=1 Tax=Acidaminobacter hydrogenoformans DSM 2784 TaxID=1120920 RepID=A0A1G5RZQ2_9FIRM|nr:hypothetical protein [Acidaminobacter hydrogenoformans]SCZ78809.1 hypothetical protein SAMN03080599_01447 [Acidaminobacter hydrogenoformans DSM 2784]